ncbi:hypothetical protein [Kitasatospora mediocidica]|uniref:hypothetical protein n=1 Tax=Kitasatospora mediocidica TaxID=58352 RepID=UPI0005685524|nr:hypothetical protein [Kitasatospora mediocidica]
MTGTNPRVAPDLVRQHATPRNSPTSPMTCSSPTSGSGPTRPRASAVWPAAMSATGVLASVTESTD